MSTNLFIKVHPSPIEHSNMEISRNKLPVNSFSSIGKKAFNIGICINHVARQLYDPLEIHYTVKISSCHHVICFETLVFRGGIEFQYIPFFFREWKSGPRTVLVNGNEKYSSFRHQGNKIMKHVNIDEKIGKRNDIKH